MAETIVFVNGSVRGSSGTSAALVRAARRFIPAGTTSDEIVLVDYDGTIEALAARLENASALIFVTGVYWSSWGSPLQRFFEVLSGFELGPCFFGKPAGALISMDSVGGADVAQRLLGVLGWFGCLVPPLASVVVSRVGETVRGREEFEDVFQTDDVGVVVHNVLALASNPRPKFEAWPITRLSPMTGPYPHTGVLHSGLSRFGEGSGIE